MVGVGLTFAHRKYLPLAGISGGNMKTAHQSQLVSVAGLVMAVALLLAGARSLAAQSPEPQKPASEVQQLKDRLQQLEQTVTDLKGQITALETGKKSPPPKLTEATYSTKTDPAATKPDPPAAIKTDPAGAATADPAADRATAVTTPRQQDPTKVGENSFQVYGFAMLDVGYQFKQNDPDWFDTVRPTKLPRFGDQFAPSGNIYLGVRQSRFGAKSTWATTHGELKTIFEFELFGVGNDVGQTTFRLRHFWGELGQFGAGQYWSVLSDTDAFPNTIEYWGPNGLLWYRNVQFRWMPIKGANSLTIGIERPGASADQGRFADRIELSNVRANFDLPDLTANARFVRSWGHLQIGGLLKRVKWVDLIDDDIDLGGSDVGWALSLSGAPKLGPNNVFRFQVTYGEGYQNYLNDGPVDVAPRFNLGSFDLRRPIEGVALPAFALSTYLDHTWSKRFTSAFGYSVVNIENSDGQAIDAFHRGHYASTNLLYTPVENAMIGGEFIWGQRRNFHDNFHADDYRIQFAFKYNFSRVFNNILDK